MQFSTYFLIFCLAVAVQTRGSEVKIPAPTAGNSDTKIKKDWSDLASQAIKLLGEAVDLLKSQIG